MKFDMNVLCLRHSKLTYLSCVWSVINMADARTSEVAGTLAPLQNPITIVCVVTRVALIVVNVFTKAVPYA
jgi:hypothetical protein